MSEMEKFGTPSGPEPGSFNIPSTLLSLSRRPPQERHTGIILEQ